MNNVLRSFNKLYNQVSKVYLRDDQKTFNSTELSMVSAKIHTPSMITVVANEKYTIQQDKLGYNVFTAAQKGLNEMSFENYSKRINLEKQKYYPNLNLTPNIQILNLNEKSEFVDTVTFGSSFLSPVNLVMGFEIINTDRGLAVMDSEKVKRFRLLKSIKAKNSHKNAYDFVVKEGEILSEALSNFNLSIDQPMISSLDQKIDSNDTDFISSEQYLGDQDRSDNSHFQTENPDFDRDWETLVDL